MTTDPYWYSRVEEPQVFHLKSDDWACYGKEPAGTLNLGSGLALCGEKLYYPERMVEREQLSAKGMTRPCIECWRRSEMGMTTAPPPKQWRGIRWLLTRYMEKRLSARKLKDGTEHVMPRV